MKRLLALAALLVAASCGSDPITTSTAQPEPIPTTVATAEPTPEKAAPTAEPTTVPTEPTAAPTTSPTQTPAQLPTATPAPAEPTVTPTAKPAPSDVEVQRAALAAARARWQAGRPAIYSMTYHLECNCDQGPWRVGVDGSGPGVGQHLAPGPNAVAPPYLSIEGIYDKIEATLSAGRYPVEFDFDDLGIPRVYSFNGPDQAVDGRFRLVIDEFLPNTDVVEPAEDRSADREALAGAIAQWAGAGLADYDYTFRRNCFCAAEYVGPYMASVRGGVVVGATYKGVDLLDIDVLGIEKYSPQVLTVAEVFAEIQDAINDAAAYTFEYHPQLGYPTKADIDWDERIADEEVGYEIADLAPPAG